MSTGTQYLEAPHEPRTPEPDGRPLAPHGRMPYVLLSLGLWALLLGGFPAWLSGGLLAVTFGGCAALALASAWRTVRAGARRAGRPRDRATAGRGA